MHEELKLNRTWPVAPGNSIPPINSERLSFEPAEQLVQKCPFLCYFLLGKQKKVKEVKREQ